MVPEDSAFQYNISPSKSSEMIITQTPLRISLFGGGSDLPGYYARYGGRVLTTAIDKYIYCIVKKRFDDKIYINYSQKEIVDSVDQIKHDLVREAMKLVGIDSGIEISFLADIPSGGSGLGSSSSVTVGVLNALYLYLGQAMDADHLAQLACQIEIDLLNKPIGVQDQYIAAFGGTRLIEFDSSGIHVHQPITSPEILEDLTSHLMVFFTGITRDSSSVLDEQQQKISHNQPLIQQMTDQASEGYKLLQEGEIKKLGHLLNETWLLKKKLSSKVSNPLIDRMYKRAIVAGAWGGKISGAGNGGFLTLLVPGHKRKTVRQALSKYKQLPIILSQDGTKAIFNIRR